MQIEALDHVNIIAADLDASARFYADVFGVEARHAPPPLKPEHARWLYSEAGVPVVHLNSRDCPREYDRGGFSGPTGAIHHVALRCTGYADTIARLTARGLEHRTNDIPAIGLRQVFVPDPDGVLLELNFPGD